MAYNNDRRPGGGGERGRNPRSNDDRRGGSQGRSDRPSFGDRPRSDRPAFGDRDRGPRRDDDRRPQRDGERRPFSSDRPRRDDSLEEPRAKRSGDPEKLPAVPEDIDVSVLPKPVLAELRSLSPGLGNFLMEHLTCAVNAMEAGDFELGLAHARAARSRGARIAVVRETCGLAAYRCEEWAEALSELRTFARITGSSEHLPILADCERGLGRPERALSLARSQEVGRLGVEGRVEMRIVASGARRDLGQLEAAIATLECKELSSKSTEPWSARLRYAYADALLAAGRKAEARDWFVKTALIDADDLTDAADRAVAIEV